VNDKNNDNFKEKYKKMLIDAATDDTQFMNAAKSYLKKLTEHDRKIFVERNSLSEPAPELYNVIENYRIENIKEAERVLIKRLK